MKYIWSSIKKEKRDSSLHKRRTLLRLLKLAIPYLKDIILAAICVLMVNSAQLINPYILKVIIDDFLIKRMPQQGIHSINFLALSYFAVVILGGFFSISQANLINIAGQKIMNNLRGRVFRTIQLLPLSYLDKMSSGKLITRATNDVEALSEMYTDVIINLFSDVFLLIGIIYTMLSLNVRLSLIAFSVVPIMFFIVFMLKKKIKNNFKNMKMLIGRINGFMAENISGMKIIQIFQGEKEKRKEFLSINDAYFQTTLFQVKLNSILKPAADVFQSLAVALLIWYGMGRIENGTLEIGVLYAFTTYIKQFFAPISDLADNYTTIQSALVSADRIFELLDQENNLEDIDKGVELKHIHGNIEFKNVWFSYDDENWILKDVSFKLSKGETMAFVGETGAGKTTIISLICGFYQIQRGEILIDGIKINNIRKKDLRNNIALVLQDVFLFSGNIEKNISLNHKLNKEKIDEALRVSYAYDFVYSLPGNISHKVMERGNTFSSGEKQLLSFARAIAQDPSIFILDEATSNIDTHTEVLIQKAIENVTKDRTTIVIAHRLSTIRNSDSIAVLRNGRIIEAGSHNELVNKNGYYKKMLDEGENQTESVLA
ncbi:MAG: ABC transporter ATP-binding protein/permease [Bacillota bacterium]|nr:ABC transporter ATP-binding protein/permease [Bacillota bacterium]